MTDATNPTPAATREKTIIGLDYDGTITRDSDMWHAVMTLMQSYGHEVHIVTMRHGVESLMSNAPMERRFLEDADGVHFTGNGESGDRDAKRPHMDAKGIRVHVWIDDNPKAVHMSAREIWGWCTQPGDTMIHSAPELGRSAVPAGSASRYRDSTPLLHVGDSSFEGWMGCYEPDRRDGRRPAFTKQDMRDAYAAGMGDPLVIARAAAPKCAMCNGHGLVGHPTGHPDASAETCPDCEGTGSTPNPTFQMRVDPWLLACFGETISRDRVERNHRFLEEALELVQAGGCSASEAHQLVEYTFARPVGELQQEVGGVMVTLAALCLAHELDMHAAGETELDRIWTKVEKIRAKQAAKPKHSPLPETVAGWTYADVDGIRHTLLNPVPGHSYWDWVQSIRDARAAGGGSAAPIDMVLHCPACGTQHVDGPEEEREQEIYLGDQVVDSAIVGWDNPPHRSHLCHNPACSHVWRPADVPTNGVAAVKTRGKRDHEPITAQTIREMMRDRATLGVLPEVPHG